MKIIINNNNDNDNNKGRFFKFWAPLLLKLSVGTVIPGRCLALLACFQK